MTIHSEDLVKNLIPSQEVLTVFLEEILLICPHEQKEFLQHADELRLKDLCPDEDVRDLTSWFEVNRYLFDDLTVSLPLDSYRRYLLCGPKQRMSELSLPSSPLHHHLTPDQLAEDLAKTANSSVLPLIVCCFASNRKSLSAALHLRQEGLDVKALTV